MALGGGTFTSQNKELPGAYINFVSAASASAALSDRGIATMPLELDWGVEGEVFEVTNEDFQKNSLKLFGYVGDYTSGFNDAIANSGVGDSIGNIDDNTGKIKDSLDVTEEDLKYLRDIAEQEAINRFTTAEINVDMSGMQNTVNSGDDIDGFMTKLTDSVNEAVDNMTEGVHE